LLQTGSSRCIGEEAVGIERIVENNMCRQELAAFERLKSQSLFFQVPRQNPWVKNGLESDPSTGIKRAPLG